jgi:hypothetical protein
MSKMEIIEVFGSRADAELAKGYLESMGIESRIIADDVDQLYPSLGVVRGVKLMTKSSLVKRAKKLISKK